MSSADRQGIVQTLTSYTQSAKRTRSRAANGSVLLNGADGRSAVYRRFRDILSQMVVDMGGDPSEAQLQIARRAASLAVWCEEADAAATRGEKLDITTYTTAANALRRLLEALGLERKQKDVTPSLGQYMRQKAKDSEIIDL